MRSEGKRCEAAFDGIDGKLFMKLTYQSLFGRLTRLNLAAGELPQAGHGFSFRPPGNKHASVFVEKGDGGNQNDRKVLHDRARRCQTVS